MAARGFAERRLARQHRWWHAPWWWLSLLTSAKSFFDNPLLTPDRHVRRLSLAHRLAWARRARLAKGVAPEQRAAFDSQGYVRTDQALPPAALSEALALAGSLLPTREHIQGDTITRRVALGPDQLASAPNLAQYLTSEPFRALLDYVGGTTAAPKFYLQTILTGAVDADPDPQTVLHRDTFHPSMKAWLYLADVELEDSPLSFVPGSHRIDRERLAWERRMAASAAHMTLPVSPRKWAEMRGSFRIDESELGAMGLPAPDRIAVPANTLIVADTVGIHGRSPSRRANMRLEIFAYSRRNPFLPLLASRPLTRRIPFRRIFWGMKLLDGLERLGIRKQQWSDVGLKRPDARQ